MEGSLFLDLNSDNEMRHLSFWAILPLILLCYACTPQLPKAAQDLAISVLCDFPPLFGNNMCQRVEIMHMQIDDLPDPQNIDIGNMRSWCVELNFIDFTGEQGSACIWLAGPNPQGDYLVQKGPEFEVSCPHAP